MRRDTQNTWCLQGVTTVTVTLVLAQHGVRSEEAINTHSENRILIPQTQEAVCG